MSDPIAQISPNSYFSSSSRPNGINLLSSIRKSSANRMPALEGVCSPNYPGMSDASSGVSTSESDHPTTDRGVHRTHNGMSAAAASHPMPTESSRMPESATRMSLNRIFYAKGFVPSADSSGNASTESSNPNSEMS